MKKVVLIILLSVFFIPLVAEAEEKEKFWVIGAKNTNIIQSDSTENENYPPNFLGSSGFLGRGYQMFGCEGYYLSYISYQILYNSKYSSFIIEGKYFIDIGLENFGGVRLISSSDMGFGVNLSKEAGSIFCGSGFKLAYKKIGFVTGANLVCEGHNNLYFVVKLDLAIKL